MKKAKKKPAPAKKPSKGYERSGRDMREDSRGMKAGGGMMKRGMR